VTQDIINEWPEEVDHVRHPSTKKESTSTFEKVFEANFLTKEEDLNKFTRNEEK